VTRTYWLSFCDTKAPEGEQFSGVAIVDVDEADMDEAMLEVLLRFGPRDDDAYWIAAAVRKAHEMGCNPGGEVQTMRIDEALRERADPPLCPRNRLLQKPELMALGHIS
jgi:hypothetical protein